MPQIEIIPLIRVFEKIEDERKSRGKRYSLVSIMLLCFVAMLCGYKTYSSISEFSNNYHDSMSECLGLGKRSPCAATIHNVLKRVGVKKFEKAISEWVESFTEGEEEVAIDGKTLRGTKKKGGKFSHLLSAFSSKLGITMYQVSTEKKTNEIGMIMELLSEIILEGRILTMDALLTQKKVSEKIISENGDYVMVAKDNQKHLREDIECVILANEWGTIPEVEVFETSEKGHGRTERRKITVSEPIIVEWPGVKQIFKIEREITRKGKISLETVYGLTSLSKEKANPEKLLKLNRNHWSIENKSHYVRDVTFDEDRIQIKNGKIAQLMALIRNIVIGIIRFEGYNNIAQAIRFYAANPFNALALAMLRIK
jgi:predicted transposase YbfD/YdcC